MTEAWISSWSFTRVLDFERCPYYAYLKYALRIKEPQGELRVGQTEQANDRGTRVHQLADQYINSKTDKLDSSLKQFSPEFLRLRWGMTQRKVTTEEEWGFDEDWNIADWRKAWHRSKLDAKYMVDAYRAVVIDFKTGRKDGNEAKHGQQLQLYALDTCLRLPHVEEVTAEAWYLDTDDMTSATYPRPVVMAFRKAWQNRGRKVTQARDFPANPNRFSCRYCMYGPWGSGDCQKGVR